MSSTPIKKQLIGLIFLLLICFSVLFGGAANGSDTVHVSPGTTTTPITIVLQWPNGTRLNNVPTSWRVSPNNGSVTLDYEHRTDAQGIARARLTFHENACGTYTVTMWSPRLPPGWLTTRKQYVHWKSCPPGSSSGTSSPPEPTKLFIVSGYNQTGLIGETLAAPFVVRVRDREQDNKPLEGVKVTFTVLTGGGSLSTTTAITDTSGLAKTTLTLGDEPGTNTVEVGAEGVSRVVTFSAEATLPPPEPTTLSILSGDNQEEFTGEALTNPFVTEVRDQHGAPMEGVTVTFTLTAGDGSLSATTAITDSDGQAESTLTLGSDPGTNTVQVSVGGIDGTVTFNAEAALPPPLPTSLSILSGDNQEGLTGESLTNPFIVQVHDQYGNPMAGVSVTFTVGETDGLLSATTVTTDPDGQAETTLTLDTEPGTVTIEAHVEGIAQTVTFNAVAELLEFDLSLSTGLNLIHLPLRVRAVDGMPTMIQSVSALYTALGGGDNVIYLFTRDTQTQQWVGYFGPSDKDTTADVELKEATGIAARLLTAKQVRLSGTPLGTNGTNTMTLNPGINFVGLPLRDSRIMQVSDLFALNGIADNVSVIQLIADGEFKTIRPTDETSDIPITGGQSFILIAEASTTVDISGAGWSNVSGAAAAPPVAMTGLQVEEATPILALRGSIASEGSELNQTGFRVIVKNRSTGKTVTTVARSEYLSHPFQWRSDVALSPNLIGGVGYRLAVVDMETGRAATIGDILEISVQSPQSRISAEPLAYTVTVEDMKRHLIQLPTLVAYEIPAETALLPNYPNPFNPETWIPYRLAEDAFVTLTIYDSKGQVVRTLDIGHRVAAIYESRSKAIYWDGRNHVGEEVASGVYFYTLTAGDFSATRRMLIIK